MDMLIEIGKWTAVAVAALLIVGGLIVSALAWLLTHSD